MEDNFIVSMKFLDRELRQMDTEFNQLTLYFFETLKSYLIRARQLKGSSSDGCEEEFAHLKKHYMLVRHEGASYQRVRVPPGKLTVHPGSYPDSGIEQSFC